MPKLSLVKQLNGMFKCAYDSDLEVAKKIKVGDIWEYEYKQSRNSRFLKKYFALLNLCFQNQDVYRNLEDLRHDLTIDSGYFTVSFNLQGDEVKRAKSISFANMEEEEFEKLYSDTLDSIIRHFNFTEEDIRENLINFF